MSGATYRTFVFQFDNEDAAKALSGELLTRFPFMDEGGPVRISAMSVGDVISASDAARMALEWRVGEAAELAEELLDCENWDACKNKIGEWDLEIQGGLLVERLSS